MPAVLAAVASSSAPDSASASESEPVRVLVVTHEARRTGAPKVALEIQRALHGESGTEVVSLLRGGGALDGEFGATSDRLLREPFARGRALLRRPKPLRKLVDRLDEVIAWSMLKRARPTVAYLNTVKSACYVRPALRLGIPTIVHVHELGVLASSTLRRYPVGARWKDVRLVACSTACRDGLAALVGVPAADIAVLHSPVDTADVTSRAAAAEPGDAGEGLTVGSCGVVNERKGADLWVAVAKAVRTLRPDLTVRFRWIGRRPGEWPSDSARQLGVDDMIDWLGETAEPYPLLAGLDVFTLPSREDPFPLVVLESMALARPIVAFDVGGVSEQLGDTGVAVAAEDVDAMAQALVKLLDDEPERHRLGNAAATRVRTLYDVAPFHTHVRGLVADQSRSG
jgi:glycosyltransferase involved in cell wall biosynthesis